MKATMFTGENAARFLTKLAVKIGTGLSGSIAERKAAEYVASEFQVMGLDTTIQEFEADTGTVPSKKLRPLSPTQMKSHARSCPSSAPYVPMVS